MVISAFGQTDAGRVKRVNQDSFLCEFKNDSGAFAVADGVGGLECGEVASSTAIGIIRDWWKSLVIKSGDHERFFIDALSGLFFQINVKLCEYNERNNIRSATTLSLLVIYKNNYCLAHCGDSRIYSGANSKSSIDLLQLTQDHSKTVWDDYNGEKVQRTVLTDGVGYKRSVRCDCSFAKLDGGRYFLICSDGVYKKVGLSEIESTVNENIQSPQGVCRELIGKAKNYGETDNITAVAVSII